MAVRWSILQSIPFLKHSGLSHDPACSSTGISFWKEGMHFKLHKTPMRINGALSTIWLNALGCEKPQFCILQSQEHSNQSFNTHAMGVGWRYLHSFSKWTLCVESLCVCIYTHVRWGWVWGNHWAKFFPFQWLFHKPKAALRMKGDSFCILSMNVESPRILQTYAQFACNALCFHYFTVYQAVVWATI